MAIVGPPFNRRFPNWEAVTEEGLPLLCTLLFGFLGAFFGAVAAAPDDAGALQGLLRVFCLTVKIKTLILVLSGVCGISFFASALLALYAKMFSIRDAPANDDEKWVAELFQTTRTKLLSYSAGVFNAGVILTPVAGLLLMPATAFWVILSVYLLIVGIVIWRLAHI